MSEIVAVRFHYPDGTSPNVILGGDYYGETVTKLYPTRIDEYTVFIIETADHSVQVAGVPYSMVRRKSVDD